MTKLLKIFSIISSIVILSCAVSLYFLYKPEKKQEKTSVSEAVLIKGIKVAVFNGCGRPGLATVFADRLRELGFDVVNGNGGNGESFDFNQSVVVDRINNRLKAEAVAKALGIDLIIYQYSSNPYIIEEIAVILGRDWNKLKTKMEVESD